MRALEVMKSTCWKENNLAHQYHFEMHGYGFKTARFYEENQLSLEFNIIKDNHDYCIERLDDDLGELINNNQDGIMFSELRNRTMQLNPASRQHYEQYINRRRESREIELIRKGKIVGVRWGKIQRNDIIKITEFKQLSLFDLL